MRLEEPADIYRALAPLQVGDAVPEQVYILDEKNGTIPRWVVVWREKVDYPGMLALIVEDQTVRPKEPPTLWGETVRRGILTWRRKTLATRTYSSDVLEWVCPRGMFCDLAQQARIENRHQQRAKVA